MICFRLLHPHNLRDRRTSGRALRSGDLREARDWVRSQIVFRSGRHQSSRRRTRIVTASAFSRIASYPVVLQNIRHHFAGNWCAITPSAPLNATLTLSEFCQHLWKCGQMHTKGIVKWRRIFCRKIVDPWGQRTAQSHHPQAGYFSVCRCEDGTAASRAHPEDEEGTQR